MHKITAKFSNIKALVVDDYPINLELIKEMLEMMGCNVDSAEDGLEALELHNKNAYDIIFMDIQMPNMDGYEATKQIRDAEGKKIHTPIIAITANALSGDKKKCLDAGMDNYISKPIRSESLGSMVNKYTNEGKNE